MNTDADFLRELLAEWKVPFQDTLFERRVAVAAFIEGKNNEINRLKEENFDLRNRLNGIYLNVSDI